MLSSDDKSAILRVSKRYKMSRLLLFGSSASPVKEGNDIDLAVEGIAPADFFLFYRKTRKMYSIQTRKLMQVLIVLKIFFY